jgi:hypothetical protein
VIQQFDLPNPLPESRCVVALADVAGAMEAPDSLSSKLEEGFFLWLTEVVATSSEDACWYASVWLGAKFSRRVLGEVFSPGAIPPSSGGGSGSKGGPGSSSGSPGVGVFLLFIPFFIV